MDANREFGIHIFKPLCENSEHIGEEGEDYYCTSSDHDVDDGSDYDDDDVYGEMSGLACPFCSEDFDVLGLCCHIDMEHQKEAKALVCPVCVIKVETNMAVHLITQHETTLKILCKKKFRNGRYRSALSFLKKELRDEYLRIAPKVSPPLNSSAAVETDSLLLPFFYNPQLSVKSEIAKPSSEASITSNSSQYCDSESREIEIPAFSDKNEEKAQRCEFIRGLLFSMILNDDF